eukprot:TRINITY_DN43771_c0_g1_i1.p1 TRINITY_DN43771_c0_g1~~TRINITY_DN43771_c0_g1_i1.p1  ORF type:complete len:260 (-),score=13.76 TRINITY_DN43771_c0_g1_i1:73-852(-)
MLVSHRPGRYFASARARLALPRAGELSYSLELRQDSTFTLTQSIAGRGVEWVGTGRVKEGHFVFEAPLPVVDGKGVSVQLKAGDDASVSLLARFGFGLSASSPKEMPMDFIDVDSQQRACPALAEQSLVLSHVAGTAVPAAYTSPAALVAHTAAPMSYNRSAPTTYTVANGASPAPNRVILMPPVSRPIPAGIAPVTYLSTMAMTAGASPTYSSAPVARAATVVYAAVPGSYAAAPVGKASAASQPNAVVSAVSSPPHI